MKKDYFFILLILFLGVFVLPALAQMTPEQQQQLQQQEQQGVQPTPTPAPNASPEPTTQQIVPNNLPEYTPDSSETIEAENNPVPELYTAPAVTNGSYSFSPFITYGGLAVVLGFFAWWEFFKRKKTKSLPAEKEPEKKVVKVEKEEYTCPTCKGKRTITKHRTVTAPCGHCKQTGIDICHHCSGTGKSGGGGFGVPLDDIENYPNDCPFCGGKGTPEVALPCCMCKGKRKETYQEPYEAPCPTCKGTGNVEK